MRLEDLRPNSAIRGVHPDGLVTVVSVQWFGSAALELTYKTPAGTVANELLYRHDEVRLEVVAEGRPWSFDGDGALFRLVSEAQRIRLAHLFDPLLAVHTSVVDPLPHQITGVYEAMLPRQPLRFLLADDPGAGKTIMAGLLIKELTARGDLERCLIVCPGSLAEQWQDELYRRFQLPFEILTNDKLEAARTRNWFLETDLVIARLDKLSRDEDVQQKLQAPDAGWDLVVCDEAHKLSATFFGGEASNSRKSRESAGGGGTDDELPLTGGIEGIRIRGANPDLTTAIRRQIGPAVVKTCGSKLYWDSWGRSIAETYRAVKTRLKGLYETSERTGQAVDWATDTFRRAIHSGIDTPQTIRMLAQ